MAEDDRLVREARALVDGGNKTVAAFLIAAGVWWFANLFPLNLSGRENGTPTDRIRLLGDSARLSTEVCSKALGTVLGGPRQESANRCNLPVAWDPLVDVDYKATDADKIDALRRTLNSLKVKQPECLGYAENGLVALDACAKARADFFRQTDDAAKAGGLDIAGLKIKEIHPRWHPLLLTVILVWGAAWIGGRRQRIFLMLNEYVRKQSAAQSAVQTFEPIFVSLPWWLWPIPNWSDVTGRGLRSLMADTAEHRRHRRNAILVAGWLLAMLVSSVALQRLLSGPAISRAFGRSDLAPGFSFTGTWFLDLAILGALLGLGCALYAWSPSAHSASAHGAASVRRRLFLTGLSGLAGAVIVPVTAEPARTAHTARRLVQLEPRHRRAGVFTVHPGPPGWYVSSGKTTSRGSTSDASVAKPRTAFFVRPGLVFKRVRRVREHPKKPKSKSSPAHLGLALRLRRWLAPANRVIERRENTIRGKRDIVETSPWLVMAPAAGTTNLPLTRVRLNKQFYSEGIEYAALKFWSAGQQSEALRVLMFGIAHVEQVRARPANIRLYDLTAGLLVRAGRDRDLPTLVKRLAALDPGSSSGTRRIGVGPPQNVTQLRPRMTKSGSKDARRIAQRSANWTNLDGKWRQKWTAGAPKKWNGVDI